MSLRALRNLKPQQDRRNQPWQPLLDDKLVGLETKVKEKFKWVHTPREFQLAAIRAQLKKQDVLVHAGTGFGKTAIAAGPHAHEDMKGKVTLLVSPLIALQEEQVMTFKTGFGLDAVAINSAHNGLTKEIMADIRKGRWHIVIVSPEMLLSKVFVTQIIRHQEMANRILAVVVDEAHVVSHWGSDFRKKYGTLEILKALLPRGTPFVAMSATLPPRVRADVLAKLQISPQNFLQLNLGNDRKNVSLVVRAMHHSMNTYRDLDFIIPSNFRAIQQIKKTFIYADNLAVATSMENHLYDLSPPELQYSGFVRPYSAAFSVEYRKNVMELFRRGVVRVLICTDAAGMGCNIPDIDTVVQWKLPGSVSSFVQRAGRAARGDGRAGLAVLLAEKSVYEADIVKHMELADERRQNPSKGSSKKKGGVREAPSYPKASKEYAIQRGVLRGNHNKANDDRSTEVDIPLDTSALDEGLYTLVQTGRCRRDVLTKVFDNARPEPTVPCCDNCDPSLLDLTRPGPSSAEKREPNIKRGVPNIDVVKRLHAWRVALARRNYKNALFTGAGLLSDDLVDLLSSVGPIDSMDRLKALIGTRWLWFSKYNNELLTELQKIPIPPMKSKPKAKRGQELDGRGENDGRATKRTRVTSIPSSSAATIDSQAVNRTVNDRPPQTNPETPSRTPSSAPNLNSTPATPAVHPYYAHLLHGTPTPHYPAFPTYSTPGQQHHPQYYPMYYPGYPYYIPRFGPPATPHSAPPPPTPPPNS